MAHTGASTSKIHTDASGSATGTLQLADTETFIFEDLPEGAKIIITEAANDHTAEYRASTGSKTASGSNTSENTALSTEQLTVTDGAVVVFTNTRTIIVPVPTGRATSNRFVLATMIILSAALYAVLRRKKQLSR